MASIAQVFGSMSPINDVLPNNAPNGFVYDLQYIPGGKQGNALRNRAENDAALAQTQQEHNDALNAYLNAMHYPPAVRAMMGEQLEKSLAKWNPKVDQAPRRPLTPSSSVVSGIRINPQNQIEIKFGKNSKPYTYKGGATVQQAAQEVLKLINSTSIDKELSKNGSWRLTHEI